MGKEEITFKVDERSKNLRAQGEVFHMDKVNEDNYLEELEKLMEEELKVRKKLKMIEEVKPTKPKASIPMIFEVFTFTTLEARVEEANEDEEFGLSVEEENQDSKKTNIEKMEVESKSKVAENIQEIKHKLDSSANSRKKENSKKAYRSRVAGIQEEMPRDEGEHGDFSPNRHNVKLKGVRLMTPSKEALHERQPELRLHFYFLFLFSLFYFHSLIYFIGLVILFCLNKVWDPISKW